jgi:hypothetical protein
VNTLTNLFRHSARLLHASSMPVVECPLTLEALQKNAEVVVKNSKLAQTTLHKFGDLWCKASKAKLDPANSVVMGPPKTRDRIVEKAVARYEGDVFQVSDGCRNRILIDDPSQVKQLKDVITRPSFLENCLAKGITVTSVEDFFEYPTVTRYRALVVKTEINLGKGRTQKAETVVMPRGWVEEYEKTHKYLEDSRSLLDLAKAQQREPTAHEVSVIDKHNREAIEIHEYLAETDGYAALELFRPEKKAKLTVLSAEAQKFNIA